MKVVSFKKAAANEFSALLTTESVSFDVFCGVPYGAWPLATILSVIHNKPGILLRKETKDYGKKKLIEGKYHKGQKVLLVEDVVTSGASIVETANILREHGLIVENVLILLDRDQGAEQKLSKNGLKMHRLLRLKNVIEVLQKAGEIQTDDVANVLKFLEASQVSNGTETKANGVGNGNGTAAVKTVLNYADRIPFCKNGVSKRLLEIINGKSTNLCCAVDLTNAEEILDVAKKIGEEICVLKLHVDTIENFSDSFISELQTIAKNLNFLLFEDRKFADIGNTVDLQFRCGIYKISSWAEIITAHALPGASVLEGLKMGCTEKTIGCLLVTEMSTRENLTLLDGYRDKCIELAETNRQFVCGYICQKRVSDDPGMINFSPGVNLKRTSDGGGQQFRSPHTAIVDDEVDVIIVGRGITEAADVREAAREYRNAAWNAYCEKMAA